VGVRDLKYFLDFADRGTRTLGEEIRPSQGGFESPFEEAVAKALGRKGWTVHTQVGVSAFRIDLAVVHPDTPGSFLAGVECDGATYHRSATARDRDKLREQELRRLGWEILRVWSTDWWVNPMDTLDTLHTKLDALLESSRAKHFGENPAPVGAVVPEASPTPTSGNLFPAVASAWPAMQTAETADPIEEGDSSRGEADGVGVAATLIDPEVFFNRAYDPTLSWMIDEIVQAEGPILDTGLARRIARRHGWQRTGTRIQARVDGMASRTHLFTREEAGRFFWPKGLPPESPVPPRKDWMALERSPDEICLQELVTLANEVQRMGARDGMALTMMARALGLGRLTSATRRRFEEAVRLTGPRENSGT